MPDGDGQLDGNRVHQIGPIYPNGCCTAMLDSSEMPITRTEVWPLLNVGPLALRLEASLKVGLVEAELLGLVERVRAKTH